MSNLKANVIYSSILTIANYVFPFVTYPYISRVLGVTNIALSNESSANESNIKGGNELC